jgi:hypothetical protein
MLELLTNVGIVAGAILALGAVLKPLYLTVRRIEQINTEVSVKLPAWQEHVDKHLKELYPNSGKSIKDQVKGTHDEVQEIKRMLEEHLTDTGAHNIRQIRAHFHLDTQPTNTDEN